MRHKFRTSVWTIAVLAMAVLLCAAPAMAATITVNSTADTTGDTTICTLRDAITSSHGSGAAGGCAAGSGTDDTINFAASLSGQTITITSELSFLDSGSITIDGSALASHVKISGNDNYRVFYIDNGMPVMLNHLDIIHGYDNGNDGAAIYGDTTGMTLIASNCKFSNNKSDDYGGVIYASEGMVTISNCTFSNNYADSEAGVIYYSNSSGTLTVSNSTFSGNTANHDSGGAIYVDDGSLTVSNSTFSNNTTPDDNGAAIYVYCDGGTMTVSDSTFSGNSAYDDGGAIYMECEDGNNSISNSTFSNNSSTDDYGGAIYIYGPLTISNSTFSGNTAYDDGGAIYMDEYYSVTISNSSFSNNSSTDGYGGAVCNWDGIFTISNSTFSGNSAYDEGGAIANDEYMTLNNSTFSNNSSTGNNGGAIYNEDYLTVNNCTFSGNSVPSSYYGGGIYNDDNLILNNSILANNTGGDCYNHSSVNAANNNLIKDAGNACDLTDGTNGNIIGSDPLLGALANNGGSTQTFALLAGSPAIDKGLSGICSPTDQRGSARVGICDIGAYEYAPPPVPPVGIVSVNMVSVGNVTATTVFATGTATGKGITERGFYWWIPPGPDTGWGGADSGLLPAGGTGAGSFSLNITGLKPSTKYHIKAYIKVSGQTDPITSDELLFTTAAAGTTGTTGGTGATGKSAPTVITTSCKLNADNTVSAAGQITDVGTSPVNVYGFVYAKHPAPYTGDNMTTTGDKALAMWDQTPLYQGLTFAGTVNNLLPGIYYLRAYAHNGSPDSDAAQTASLAYGTDCTFTVACTQAMCPMGDVNGDGYVNLADAVLVLKILAEIPVTDYINPYANVNGDGKIGLEELAFILQKAAGLR